MKFRISIWLATLLITAILAGRSFAVDCNRKTSSILTDIAKCDLERNRQEMIELLHCLWAPANDLIMNYDDFIKEDTFDKIEKATVNDRLDVIRILVPFLEAKDRIVRNEAIAALAYYKYPTAKQLLADFPDGPPKAALYALLGYGSSYRWAIDQLEKLKRGEDQGGVVTIFDWMAYLDLLYRLAEPGSLSYVSDLAKSSLPEEIRMRADMVRERILKLHPEIK